MRGSLLNRTGQNSQRGWSPLLCGWSSDATGGSVCFPGRESNFVLSEMAICWLSSHYSSLSVVGSFYSDELISYYLSWTWSVSITVLPPIFIGHSPHFISAEIINQRIKNAKYSKFGKTENFRNEGFHPIWRMMDVSPAFELYQDMMWCVNSSTGPC